MGQGKTRGRSITFNGMEALKLGEQAPDLDLLDEAGRPVALSSQAAGRPLLVLVFRGPDDEAGLRLLRDYRDLTLAFRRAGVNLCGIAVADPSSLAYMRRERGLAFPLLADPDGSALSRWQMADQNGLVLLDRSLHVRQSALGGRATASAMLAFVRRSGQPRGIARFFTALQHVLLPKRLAR